jgi:DNA polymerase III subunit beta
MQFSVQRDELLLAVSSVTRATATRVIQPILANILLEADSEGGALKLAATDLDFSLQTRLNATIQQPGRTTLSGKKITEILAKLPPKATVQFTVDNTVQTCRVECGASVFDIRTLSADEFPQLPTLDVEQSLEVDLATFLRSVRQTEFAAASYETNNILGGVFFKLSADALEMVATDGSRLARRMEVLEGNGVRDTLTAIIPARILQEFLKLAGSSLNTPVPKGEEGHVPNPDENKPTVRLSLQQGLVFLATPRILAVSRLLDGQYPRYEQLIPKTNSIVLLANKQALIASLERTAIMANERTHIVRMNLELGRLILAADTPDVGNSKDMVPVRYDGEPLQIAFNYKYVLDALKVIDSDDVRMETNGALAPTLFRSCAIKGEDANKPEGLEDGYLCLVMPVQVK